MIKKGEVWDRVLARHNTSSSVLFSAHSCFWEQQLQPKAETRRGRHDAQVLPRRWLDRLAFRGRSHKWCPPSLSLTDTHLAHCPCACSPIISNLRRSISQLTIKKGPGYNRMWKALGSIPNITNKQNPHKTQQKIPQLLQVQNSSFPSKSPATVFPTSEF